jgi:hypothetical protein
MREREATLFGNRFETISSSGASALCAHERLDLSQAERNSFQRLTKQLVESYRRPKP